MRFQTTEDCFEHLPWAGTSHGLWQPWGILGSCPFSFPTETRQKKTLYGDVRAWMWLRILFNPALLWEVFTGIN